MNFGEGKPDSEKHIMKAYIHVVIFPVVIPSMALPGGIRAVVLLTDKNL